MEAITASDSNVLGHYCRAGNSDSEWQPVLGEATSTPLFTAVVEDSISTVESYFERDLSRINTFFLLLYWGAEGEDEQDTQGGQTDQGPQKVQVKPRTLAMIAAYHGSMRVLAFFLSKGADPRLKSPEGLVAADFALAGKSPNAPTVRAMLEDAGSNFTAPSGQQLDPVVAPPSSSGAPSVQQGQAQQQQQQQLAQSQRRSFTDMGSGPAMQNDRLVASPSSLSVGLEPPALAQEPSSGPGVGGGEGDPYNPENLPYSTAELTRPEYSTDTFRMFCFKVLRCSKRYAHDWRACPFAHPTENARRRDPREFQYCSVACPDYKQGFCIQGDACQYAHGVFECWLHPSRYRTQLCKDGAGCRRPVCFFAHTLAELRTPTHMFVPGAEDRSGGRSPAALTPSPIGPGPMGGAPDYSQLAAAAAEQQQQSQQPQAFSPDAYADAFAGADQNRVETLLQQHQQAVAAAGIGGSDALLDASLGGADVLGRGSGGPDVAISGLSGLPIAGGRGGGVDQGQGGASPRKQLAAAAAAAAAAAGQYGAQQHMHAPQHSGGHQRHQHQQQQHMQQQMVVQQQHMQHVAPPYFSGVPAPRMSNAFARRHGLNPKDSPIVNLQRIALAHHPGPLIPAYYGHPGMPDVGSVGAGPSSSSGASGSSSRGRHHRKGSHHGGQHAMMQQHLQQQQQQQQQHLAAAQAMHQQQAMQAQMHHMPPPRFYAQVPQQQQAMLSQQQVQDPQALALLFANASLGGPQQQMLPPNSSAGPMLNLGPHYMGPQGPPFYE